MNEPVDAGPASHPGTPEAGPRSRRYARPRLIRVLADGVVLIGWLLAVSGVVLVINSATLTGGFVVVPVSAEPPALVRQVTADSALLSLPDGNRLRAEDGRWELRSWRSTLPEQLLSRADRALLGLATLAAALLARQVLLAIAAGRPFAPGNARRIATIAALVAVEGTVAPLLPRLATSLVLERISMTGPDALVRAAEPVLSLDPLLVAALLLVTAECFRHGAELADDVAGLV